MASSRNKGKAGEREVVNLLRVITGVDVRRRVRQHEGDSDIEGIPGWSIEVKRDNGKSVDAMWKQTCKQASRSGMLPLLLWRRDRRPWRARFVLPFALWEFDAMDGEGAWVESTPETWWFAAQEWEEVKDGREVDDA